MKQERYFIFIILVCILILHRLVARAQHSLTDRIPIGNSFELGADALLSRCVAIGWCLVNLRQPCRAILRLAAEA